MAEVAPRPPDEESKAIPETDGETRSGKPKADEKKPFSAEASEGEKEREQRRRDLEREREEAKETAAKTAEAAQEVAEIVRRATKEKQAETPREAAGVKSTPEGIPIVESPKPLEFLPRDQVTQIFKSQDVKMSVPADWDRWDHIKRRIWLEKNQVVETIQFPEADVLYRDEKNKIAVGKDQKGYVLMGSRDLEPETVKKILKKAKVDIELTPPADWQQKSFDEKRQWYRQAGIEVSTGIAVGGVRWLDNYLVDADTASDRLGQLEAEKETNPANFYNQGWEADLRELSVHLKNLTTGRPTEIIQGLLVNPNDAGMQDALNSLVEQARKSGDPNNPNFRGFGNYRFVRNLERTIEDYVNRAQPAGQLGLLNQILSPATRAEISQIRERISDRFKNLEDGKKQRDPGGLASLYQVLEANESSYLRSLRSGFFGDIAVAEQETFRTVARERYRELAGEQGLLEWRAVTQMENMDRLHRVDFLRGSPIDWRESVINAKQNLLFIESTDFPPEQLQDALSRVVRITDDLNAVIPTLSGREREDAEEMLRDVNEFKDSVEAIYRYRVTVEGASMNPERVLPVFESPSWKDITFKYYFKRFSKDHREREFVDQNDNKFNLLDKAMQLYFKTFREERLRMNKIEDLTLGELDPNSNDTDVQWFVNWMRSRNYALSDWGRDLGRTREAISEWYRTSTLLGAHGVDATGQQFLDMRRDELLEELKRTLAGLGYSQDRINEYVQAGLFKQVINNAYHLTWSLGAFSDYDIIRIWDRTKDWFDGRKMLGEVVFNNDSRLWWGRHIDHYAEFLHTEPRGRAGRFGRVDDANYLFQKHMLGKRRNILPNNRLLVKLINDNLSYLKELDGNVFSLDATGRGMRVEDQIQERVGELENRDKLDLDDRDDRGFARGWATAELIDFGEISFENVEWSKVFDKENPNINISKFNMTDWWFDRITTTKYFSPAMMQSYLQFPNTKLFFEANSIENFYSKREIRIKPWMKLVTPAHFELGKWWKKWWKLPYNMPHAEKEEVIDYAVATNRLDAKYHHGMKLQYLGWGPLGGGITVRRLRQLAEFADVAARETGKRAYWYPLAVIWEFIKQAFGQTQAQLAGR